jgi:hypothetical protein
MRQPAATLASLRVELPEGSNVERQTAIRPTSGNFARNPKSPSESDREAQAVM